MPVTNKHSLYQEQEHCWEEIRDCVKGNRAIKAKRTKYLPMLSGMSHEEYERYQKKVKFFGATGRALEGFHGNIFRKSSEQSIEMPDSFLESLEDVDLLGTTVDQFASDLIWDCLQTNWGGILVDYAKGEGASSLAQAEEQGCKAYLKHYEAERVINWAYSTVNGKMQLSMVVLEEPYSMPSPNDRFTSIESHIYRVLYLDKNGNYTQDVYDERQSLEIPSEQGIVIKMHGQFLKEIPFFTCPGNLPEKSMLYDLSQLNLQHYIETADYNNGKFYTSIPTPCAINLRPEIDELTGKPKPTYLGGMQMNYFPNSDGVAGADVKYLEFSGSGLKALSEAINHLETQMAILGAHIIAAEKKGVESPEALRIHRIGENGILASFTRNMSDQITKALRLRGKWNGESEELLEDWSINFNTDYDLSSEDSRTLSTLITGRTAGEIPRMSMYLGLKSLNLIPEQWQFEQFIEELERDREELLPEMPEDEPEVPAQGDEQDEDEDRQEEENDGQNQD